MTRFRKVVGMILIAALAVVVLSAVVMWLWNGVLVHAASVNPIGFGEAAGILVLSRILFGGFRGGGGGWRGRRGAMMEKWNAMSPEERAKFKEQWRDRCRGRGWERRDVSEAENPV